MINFKELKRRTTGLVIGKFAVDFRTSLIMLVFLLFVVGGLTWKFFQGVSENFLVISDVFTQQSPDIVYREINKVRTEVNRLKEERIIERTSDPELAKQFQQLHHLVGILEQQGQRSVLDFDKAKYGIMDLEQLLTIGEKILYLLSGVILLFVMIISWRTFTSIRVMTQQLKDLNGDLTEGPEAGNENEIDFARRMVVQAKNLQEQQQKFEDQCRPHLDASSDQDANIKRDPPRTAVRFKTALPVVLSLNSRTLSMTAINYSETGILLKSEHNAAPVLELQQQIAGKIGTEQKQSNFTGTVVRMQQRPDGDLYGLKFIVAPW